jgi:hypothetical protein
VDSELFKLCPRCRGRGTIDTPQGTAACISCAPRYVMRAGVSEEGVEELRQANERLRTLLERESLWCSELLRQWGLPYPRTCRRCGVGGPCTNPRAGSPHTPLQT